MGKHRKPPPIKPLMPGIIGASIATAGLLAATVAAAPSQHPIVSPLKPPPHLSLPPLTVAQAATFLPTLPAATDAEVATTALAVSNSGRSSARPAVTRTAPTVKTAGTPGGLAARAISAALAQQGTPYVYGGAAPGGFDCSGLVQWALARAGVFMPRTAAAQSAIGRTVSLRDLQPGDLLYFYEPVEHVVMFIGDGKIVEASQPGTPVHVRPLYTSGLSVIKRVF